MTERISRIASTRVSADYLHANSTNHNWVFGAFAEFFDNSFDAKAREVQIDVVNLGEKLCLHFQDDGIGMGKEDLYNMLSFGFCGRHLSAAIGKYGNGFKSGSMRLGKDAIVFTRNKQTAGVGLLSQTFNSNTEAETVLVPMLHYSLPDLMHDEHEYHSENLVAILEHSMFENEEKLKKQIRQLPKTGTGIIIYNLHRTCDSSYLELDFDTDPKDIRCPDIYDAGNQHASLYRISLKEYCSILYLKPRMKIKLRGNYVKTKLIAKSLCNTQVDEYIPRVSTSQQEDLYAHRGQTNTIIFGFLPNSTDSGDYGMMLYSDNRLIKPYEKVSCQRRGDGVGAGVVGVTQAKFLTPTNMKQDFVRDQKYMSPDSMWVQCDYKNCLKWRRLPPAVDPADLPDKWYCHMHPDNIRCDSPEDMHEDEDVIQPPSRSRSVSSRIAEPITGKKKRKRKNLSLSVESDSAHSSQSLSAVDKASASANQKAHSKYANSSHLRVSERALRGSSKKKSQVHNEKAVGTSSGQKRIQVNSRKVVRTSLRRKTRQVNSSETVRNSVKSAARRALRGARCTEGSTSPEGGGESSVENQHGPGDDSFCGDETVDDDDHLSTGAKQRDSVSDVTDKNINDITDENINDVTDKNINDVTDKNINDVTDKNINDVTDENINDITDENINDVTDENINDVTDKNINDITDENINDVTDENINDITDENINDVTAENITEDTEHDDDDVTDLPVDLELRSNASSSVDDDADEADSSNLLQPENELSQLQSEFNRLRERFQTLLNNSRRLLEMLAPQIEIDTDVDIEQLIAKMVEQGFH